MSVTLHLSYDRDLDWLECAPFGVVMDRQGPARWSGLCQAFGWFLDREGGTPVGFKVLGFSAFDAQAPAVAGIFAGPRFDVPALGLGDVSAGQVVLAAGPFLGGESTIDRVCFGEAMAARGDEALACWIAALQAGNGMAHYGAGYTLLDLGRPREAYRHLRRYTELVPRDAWAWAQRARAAAGIGERSEALACIERAIALEVETDEATDAGELRAELEAADA